MVHVSHEFVAEKLWLLVALLTLPVTAIAAVFGGILPLPGALVALLVTGVPILGWLLLTPLLLLFGEEVADALVGQTGRIDSEGGPAATAADPVETLKRRYADGELTEAEFEHRLERLLALDDVDFPGDRDPRRSGADGETPANRSPGRARDDDLLERE